MTFAIPKFPKQHPMWLMMAVLVLLIGFYFGTHGIMIDTLRPDELTTLGHIGALEEDGRIVSLQETTESLAELSAQHPPLYFWIANVWGRLTEYDAFALRLLSVFFGVLSLAVVFRLATDVSSPVTAIFATFFLATSIVFVFYMHDIRQYTAMVFWCSSFWLVYQRLSQKKTVHWYELGALTIITLGAVFTHYSSLFLLIPVGMYHLLMFRRIRSWWKISVAVCLAGVLFLPWLPTALGGFEHTTYEIEVGESEYMPNPLLVDEVIRFWGNGEPLIFAALMAIGFLAVVFNHRGSRYLLFFLIATTVVILAMNHYLTFVKWIRYAIVYLVPFSLFAGAGLAWLTRWRLLAILPIFVFVPYISTGTAFQNTIDFMHQARVLTIQTSVEFQYLVPVLRDLVEPDDILVPLIRHNALVRPGKHRQLSIEEFYINELGIPYANIYSGRPTRREFVLEDVMNAIDGHPAVWMSYTNGTSSDYREVAEALSQTHEMCSEVKYGGVGSVLQLYVLKGTTDDRCTILEQR